MLMFCNLQAYLRVKREDSVRLRVVSVTRRIGQCIVVVVGDLVLNVLGVIKSGYGRSEKCCVLNWGKVDC